MFVMETKVSEIYKVLGQYTLDLIPEISWKSAYLNIKVVPKNVGINGKYINSANEEKTLRTRFGEEISTALHLLHKTTTENDHNQWNRAVFNLTSDGKFDMEFIWDKELDDAINGK